MKRKYVLGKDLLLDEYSNFRLMYAYYATDNQNPEVFAWQDICITLDDMGIFEKYMYQYKEDLKNILLMIKNPYYQSDLYRIFTEHVKEKMNPK